jgi:hypothetical protein
MIARLAVPLLVAFAFAIEAQVKVAEPSNERTDNDRAPVRATRAGAQMLATA